MARRLVQVVVIGVFTVLSCAVAGADGDQEVRKELEGLKRRVEELEAGLGLQGTAEVEQTGAMPVADRVEALGEEVERLGYSQRVGAAVLDALDGVGLGGGLTFIGQGTAGNEGSDSAGGDTAEVSVSGDLDVTMPVGEYGLGYGRGLVGRGEGVAHALPSGFSGANADLEVGEDNFKLAEAWYELILPYPTVVDRRVGFQLGAMDPTGFFDANSVANDETQQFLADVFVNNLAIDWGGDDNGYGLGARLAWRLTSVYNKALTVETHFGLFEGDGDYTDALDHPFAIGELDVSRSYYGLLGNYRMFGWTNRTDHLDFEDIEGEGKPSWGAGVSLDQQVASDLTLFLRYGWQDPAVSTFDHAVSLGGRLYGNLWRRGGDVLGLAAAYTHGSDKYGKVSERLDGAAVSGGETFAEVYYSYRLEAGVRVSPHVQYVSNPGAVVGAGDLFLYALRVQIDF
ncbi:MAG: carbohydrate porin [Candidatus Schekmanbacteria bacterium]|nr:carbohydrate porin [Candidatus Schekmanbacteria bacterium]